MIQLGGSAFHVFISVPLLRKFQKDHEKNNRTSSNVFVFYGFECLVILNVEPFDTNPSNNDLLHAAIASHYLTMKSEPVLGKA